jgi:hypothetical protein
LHLKADSDAVEFLRKFGLAFIFVVFGAIYFMRYRSSWRSSKHKDNDEPKGDE